MYPGLKTSLSLYIPAALLTLAGLLTIYSIKPDLAISQLVFFGISLLLSLAVSRLKLGNGWLPINPLMLIIIFSLIVTSIFGPSTRGSSRWLIVFGQQIQTSEFAKIGLILFAATYFSTHSIKKLYAIIKFIVVMGIPLIIVLYQPDLGSAIIMGVIVMSCLISAGISLKRLGLIIVVIAILSPLIIFTLKPYQVSRLTSFIHPQSDPLGVGYNALQATIAVGSGQFLGRGLGQGTQSHLRFLPERHTDFIYASLVEELGFIGGFLIIAIYAWLCTALIYQSKHSTSACHSLTCIIFACLITIQATINIGMNLGIMPITGITLPFVSYGGSSLLASYLILGMCNLPHDQNKNRSIRMHIH